MTTDNIEPVEEQEETIEELEQRIALLEQARINIRTTPVIFDRLYRQAEFLGVTIEEHCAKILEDSLNTMIGKAHITAPSHFGETETVTKKITAPTYQVTRG